MSLGAPRATYGRVMTMIRQGRLGSAPKGPIEYAEISQERRMRPFAVALMMSLTAFAAASAQPATPDSE